MPFDRSDFAAKVSSLTDTRIKAQMPVLDVITRAAVVMDSMMTSSEAWNRYLEILQGFGERVTLARDRAQSALADPSIWSAPDLHKLKADVLCCNAQIDLLAYVMALPKAIIAGGAEVETIKRQFEEKHAESAGPAG
jgi:hypothetical protein